MVMRVFLSVFNIWYLYKILILQHLWLLHVITLNTVSSYPERNYVTCNGKSEHAKFENEQEMVKLILKMKDKSLWKWTEL